MLNCYTILHFLVADEDNHDRFVDRPCLFYLGQFDDYDEDLWLSMVMDKANDLCITLKAHSYSIVTDLGDFIRTIQEDAK